MGDRLPRVDTLESVALLLRAYKKIFNGEMLDALYYINKAIELEPNFNLPYFIKGIILMCLGDVKKASEIFEMLIKKGSKNPLDWIYLGECYTAIGNCEEAIKCYKNASSESEKLISSAILEILCLESLGEYETSLEIIDKVLSQYPKMLSFWIKKVEILLHLGEYEKALLTIDEALKLNPEHKLALFYKALILSRLGRLKESLEIFKKLIDKYNIKWLEALRHAARVAIYLGEYETAEKYLKKGLEIRDDDTELLFNLGVVLAEKGKSEEAIKYFEKVLSLHPGYTLALLRIANIYERLGKLDKAVEYYNKVYAQIMPKENNDLE